MSFPFSRWRAPQRSVWRPPGLARADDLATYEITLKDHHFNPAEIHVPSGKPFFVCRHQVRATPPTNSRCLIPALEKTLAAGDSRAK